MRQGGRAHRLWVTLLPALLCAGAAAAQTPLAGHYPPGQSGIRGAAAAKPGWSVTNFNRFFSNLEAVDDGGETISEPDEMRYANITMITWTTPHEIFGMRYGAMAGIPFSTGNLNPGADESASGFGLGDVLLTPLSLYGESPAFDYTFQFTVWSSSGHFEPGGTKNRGAGFWSLVYSLGGVWYPGGDRGDWSASALARFEQNFEQQGTEPQSRRRPGGRLGSVREWSGSDSMSASRASPPGSSPSSPAAIRSRHPTGTGTSASARKPACGHGPSGRSACAPIGSSQPAMPCRGTTCG